MRRSFLLLLLLLLLPLFATAGEKLLPFAPHDANRDVDATIATVRNSSHKGAFMRELVKIAKPDGLDEQTLIIALTEGEGHQQVVDVTGCTLEVAGLTKNGSVQYIRRVAYPGERAFVLEQRPLISLFCGNPIRRLDCPRQKQQPPPRSWCDAHPPTITVVDGVKNSGYWFTCFGGK